MRTVFRRCRGVPFKRRGSLGGCRLKNSFRNRGVQGGRGEGGKVNLPPYTWLIHAEGRRIHTFFDVSFWTSFFDILAHPRTKTVDFGTPLAPSWAPNGAQNRPSGAKMLTFSQRRAPPGRVLESSCFQGHFLSVPGYHFGRFVGCPSPPKWMPKRCLNGSVVNMNAINMILSVLKMPKK